MTDFGSFGAILGYLNDEILQNPISTTAFMIFQMEQKKMPFLELFENLFTGICIEK